MPAHRRCISDVKAESARCWIGTMTVEKPFPGRKILPNNKQQQQWFRLDRGMKSTKVSAWNVGNFFLAFFNEFSRLTLPLCWRIFFPMRTHKHRIFVIKFRRIHFHANVCCICDLWRFLMKAITPGKQRREDLLKIVIKEKSSAKTELRNFNLRGGSPRSPVGLLISLFDSTTDEWRRRNSWRLPGNLFNWIINNKAKIADDN